MDLDKDDYRISKWLLEFKDRTVEHAYQSHVQRISIRQLRMALGIWAGLLLAFAIPDYVALGLTRSFYYLFCYRLVIVASLLMTFLNITLKTNFFKTSSTLAVYYRSGPLQADQ